MVQESLDQKAPRVMVVEDDPRSVKLLEAYLLPEGYQMVTANDGIDALNKLDRETVDIILLDIMMPNMNGYEVCKQLKADKNSRFIPIIMMTALRSREDRIRGIEAGTDDFLTKPVDREELLARIRSLLRVKNLNEQLEDAENVLYVLSNMLDAKDHYTEGHSQRVTKFAIYLAKALRLSLSDQDMLKKAGLLHDIGKVGVPENVLNKPGPLTPEEFELIKKHPVLSEKICSPLRSMKNILGIIRHHHESFDGKGYPDGLRGEEIPLGSRILAVADAFDAMGSDRPYRKGMPKEKVIKVLKEGAGVQWDPKLVDLFTNLI